MLFNIDEVLANKWHWVSGSSKISFDDACKELTEGHASLKLAYDLLRTGAYAKDLEEYVDATSSKHLIWLLEIAYQYAVAGKYGFTEPEQPNDLGMAISAIRPIAESIDAGPAPVNCENIAVLCVLRGSLDSQLGRGSFEEFDIVEADCFSLYHISLLARMNEKSVRNATQPTATDRLITYKKGGRTFVAAKDADDWLSRRRGYKPSIQL